MSPIPFTVVGGFLGAGKTTLINRLLRNEDGIRYAVMVNDFGAVNIDQSLIARHSGQTLSLTNGCICCSLAGGFVKAMVALMQQPEGIDHIVVEASGVSDPGRIMDFARLDAELREDATVVLVDALNFPVQVKDPLINDMLLQQVSQADIIVVNKTDLVDAHSLHKLVKALLRLSERAKVINTVQANLPVDLLFGVKPDVHNSSAMLIKKFGDSTVSAETIFRSIAFGSKQPIDIHRFEKFNSQLPDNVIRGKGLLQLSTGDFQWHRVAARSQLTPVEDPLKSSELVLIGYQDKQMFERIRRDALDNLFRCELG